MIRALCSSGSRSGDPATRARSWSCASSGRVDAEDRDRRRQGRRRCSPREVGPPLERGGGDRDAGRLGDRRDRLGGQAGLAERRDAQVGASDEVADGAADRRLDAGVRRQAGEQDGDAERDAERAQDGAQRSGAEAAEGEAVRDMADGPTARAGPAAR